MGRLRIVAVVAPAWMMKVDDVIAVEGRHRVVETQRPDPPPVLERPLGEAEQRELRSVVGYLDMKSELAPRRGIALVENLAQHLVANIEVSPSTRGVSAVISRRI